MSGMPVHLPSCICLPWGSLGFGQNLWPCLSTRVPRDNLRHFKNGTLPPRLQAFRVIGTHRGGEEEEISHKTGIPIPVGMYVGRERADVTVHSDASGSWGCGAKAGKSWLQHQWIQGWSDSLSIAVKEITPIVMAAMVWGGAWLRKVIRFYCDNEAVVANLTSLSCKDRELWSLLRCLIFMAARYSFWFSAVHIPGRLNTLADALSRYKREVFQLQALDMVDPSPTSIPHALPEVLYGT